MKQFLTKCSYTHILILSPPGLYLYRHGIHHCLTPPSSPYTLYSPLKTLKLRGYLVYISFILKMYMIVYIYPHPPMASCPPVKSIKTFKSLESLSPALKTLKVFLVYPALLQTLSSFQTEETLETFKILQNLFKNPKGFQRLSRFFNLKINPRFSFKDF